jgi:hypothetical protein
MTESEEDVIDHEVVRETESEDTGTEIVHGRARGGGTMVAMIGADTDHEAATTSDETIMQSAGANATSMRNDQGHFRETADVERTRGAGHHTRGARGEETEA